MGKQPQRILRFAVHTAAALWIPFLLAGIFVVQNELFNEWIGIYTDNYAVLSIVATFALGLLLYAPSILFRGKSRFVYLLVVSVIVSAIFIAQYLYHSYFGGFLQESAFNYALQAGDESGTIFTLISPQLALFVVNVVAVLLMYSLARARTLVRFVPRASVRVAAIAIALILVVAGYGALLAGGNVSPAAIANIPLTLQDLGRFTWSPDDQVAKVGVVNYYLGDIIGSAMRRFQVTSQDLQLVEAWSGSSRVAQKSPADRGLVKGRNLIFIQVESMENSVINKTIGGQEITPNLDALARQGLYFDNYYTQVGPGNTADAEFVTLDSLYPLSNDVAFIDYAHNTYDALPELLDENGYHTYVLHDDVPDFWNRANMYPSLGYETVISKGGFTPQGEEIMGGVGDKVFFDEAAQKMTQFKQPFMATLITISSHTPFQIPPDLQTLTIPAGSNLTPTQQNYLVAVHYADAAIGEFIADLKKEGLYDNSLIVIYGDHGSFTGISEQLDTDKATTLADLRANQVPLIILAPKTKLVGTDTEPGSHLDLYPTVANLLGVKLTSQVFGQDLLNTKTPVETHVDPDTQAIRSILTPTLAYSGSNDGVFGNGTCYKMPGLIETALSACQSVYDTQEQAVLASNIIVRGNLEKMLSLGNVTENP